MRVRPGPRALRGWLSIVATLIACLALALIANPAALGAQQTDVIRGHVTNSDGLPLAGVRVTATSIPGNVTRETRTSDKGIYQIAFPGGPGDYIMGFAMIGYVFRQFEIKRLADEEVLIADARLTVIQLDTVSVTAPQQQRVGRNSQTPDVSGTERPISPSNLPAELQGDIAAMAASLPGVLLVPGLDGGPDGFSVLGLGADQNSVTLNGLQVGANGLPRDANVSSSLTTSSYDVAKGGFSGANFNIRSSSGSNFRSRGMSLVGSAPQLQWTDPAARSLGNEYTNLSLGGVASGPIKLNKAFYNVSFQLGRQSRDNQSLLATDALGLETAGIAMDSVGRFIDILERSGVPAVESRFRSERLSDNGSVFGSMDISPPSSSSGQSFGMTFNGNWGHQSPIGGGITQLPSASGDRTNWSGGLQGRHNGYFGLILSETSAGINMSQDYGNPYLRLPSGRVLVNSLFDDGVSSVQTLTFGGNQGLSSTSHALSGTLQNNLSWFDDANKHRIKLTTELGYSANTQNLASNLLGSFSFNSLGDLDAGLPASYSRTLTARRRSSGQLTGSVAIGDSWRKHDRPADPVWSSCGREPFHEDAGIQSARGDGVRSSQRSRANADQSESAHRILVDGRPGAGDLGIQRRVANAARRRSRRGWHLHERLERRADRIGAGQYRSRRPAPSRSTALVRPFRFRIGQCTPTTRPACRIGVPTARPARCSRTRRLT